MNQGCVALALSLCLLQAAGPVHAQATPIASGKNQLNQFAKGSFVVKVLPLVFEGQPEAGALGRMSIDKEISGDLVATSKGQMLSAGTETKGSAGYVAIEHVVGTLHGRKGSFTLQHSGTMNRGAPSLSVSVVPDSGTGELVGLIGDFKIIRVAGKHSYEFNYSLL